VYFRFSVNKGLDSICPDEYESLEKVSAWTIAYLEQTPVASEVQACAESLGSKFVESFMKELAALDANEISKDTGIGGDIPFTVNLIERYFHAREIKVKQKLERLEKDKIHLVNELAWARYGIEIANNATGCAWELRRARTLRGVSVVVTIITRWNDWQVTRRSACKALGSLCQLCWL
jgi:hypothetical protein